MKSCDLISAWDDNPDYGIDIEPVSQRIQVKYMGIVIVDSDNVLLLNEPELNPKYYFPINDIVGKYFCITDKVSFSPYKGLATHWALILGNDRIDCAAWSYDDPFTKSTEIKSHIAFYPNDDIEFIVDFNNSNIIQASYFTSFNIDNRQFTVH